MPLSEEDGEEFESRGMLSPGPKINANKTKIPSHMSFKALNTFTSNSNMNNNKNQSSMGLKKNPTLNNKTQTQQLRFQLQNDIYPTSMELNVEDKVQE